MASETSLLPFHLPIIDFSDQSLTPGEPEWDLTKAHVLKALQDYGCFEASFAKISFELLKSVLGAVEELFDLPLETKQKMVSQKQSGGYLPQQPMVSLPESMSINDPEVAAKVNAFTKTLWPQGNEGISTTIQSFSEKLSELDKTIIRMVMESFGLERYVDEQLYATDYILRVIKYEGHEAEETKLGLKTHTDKNMIRILHQNHVGGLEVKTKDNIWVEVKPSQGSFFVIVGDSFHALMNGRVHSPYHRVMMTGTKTRYSVGLFSIPKAGHMVSSPDELVDEEHPRLFKPYNFVEFQKFVFSEAGQRCESALKTYCGM